MRAKQAITLRSLVDPLSQDGAGGGLRVDPLGNVHYDGIESSDSDGGGAEGSSSIGGGGASSGANAGGGGSNGIVRTSSYRRRKASKSASSMVGAGGGVGGGALPASDMGNGGLVSVLERTRGLLVDSDGGVLPSSLNPTRPFSIRHNTTSLEFTPVPFKRPKQLPKRVGGGVAEGANRFAPPAFTNAAAVAFECEDVVVMFGGSVSTSGVASSVGSLTTSSVPHGLSGGLSHSSSSSLQAPSRTVNETWIYSVLEKQWSFVDVMEVPPESLTKSRRARGFSGDLLPPPRCGHCAVGIREVQLGVTSTLEKPATGGLAEGSAMAGSSMGRGIDSTSVLGAGKDRSLIRSKKDLFLPNRSGALGDSVLFGPQPAQQVLLANRAGAHIGENSSYMTSSRSGPVGGDPRDPEPWSYRPSMIVFGGANHNLGIYYNDLWLFDVQCRAWKQLQPIGTPPSPRWKATVAACEQRVFIFGGETSSFQIVNDLHMYDHLSGAWRSLRVTEPCPRPRMGHSATVVGDKMIIVGGVDRAAHVLLGKTAGATNTSTTLHSSGADGISGDIASTETSDAPTRRAGRDRSASTVAGSARDRTQDPLDNSQGNLRIRPSTRASTSGATSTTVPATSGAVNFVTNKHAGNGDAPPLSPFQPSSSTVPPSPANNNNNSSTNTNVTLSNNNNASTVSPGRVTNHSLPLGGGRPVAPSVLSDIWCLDMRSLLWRELGVLDKRNSVFALHEDERGAARNNGGTDLPIPARRLSAAEASEASMTPTNAALRPTESSISARAGGLSPISAKDFASMGSNSNVTSPVAGRAYGGGSRGSSPSRGLFYGAGQGQGGKTLPGAPHVIGYGSLEGHVAIGFNQHIVIHGGMVNGKWNQRLFSFDTANETWQFHGEINTTGGFSAGDGSPTISIHTSGGAQYGRRGASEDNGGLVVPPTTKPQPRAFHCGGAFVHRSCPHSLKQFDTIGRMQDGSLHLSELKETEPLLDFFVVTRAQQLAETGILTIYKNRPVTQRTVCVFIYGGQSFPRNLSDMWMIRLTDKSLRARELGGYGGGTTNSTMAALAPTRDRRSDELTSARSASDNGTGVPTIPLLATGIAQALVVPISSSPPQPSQSGLRSEPSSPSRQSPLSSTKNSTYHLSINQNASSLTPISGTPVRGGGGGDGELGTPTTRERLHAALSSNSSSRNLNSGGRRRAGGVTDSSGYSNQQILADVLYAASKGGVLLTDPNVVLPRLLGDSRGGMVAGDDQKPSLSQGVGMSGGYSSHAGAQASLGGGGPTSQNQIVSQLKALRQQAAKRDDGTFARSQRSAVPEGYFPAIEDLARTSDAEDEEQQVTKGGQLYSSFALGRGGGRQANDTASAAANKRLRLGLPQSEVQQSVPFSGAEDELSSNSDAESHDSDDDDDELRAIQAEQRRRRIEDRKQRLVDQLRAEIVNAAHQYVLGGQKTAMRKQRRPSASQHRGQ